MPYAQSGSCLAPTLGLASASFVDGSASDGDIAAAALSIPMGVSIEDGGGADE